MIVAHTDKFIHTSHTNTQRVCVRAAVTTPIVPHLLGISPR